MKELEKIIKDLKEVKNSIVESLDSYSNRQYFDASIMIADFNDDIHKLQQAQKIINKYDIDTNKKELSNA